MSDESTKMTQGRLAQVIRAVRDAEHDSSAAEQPLLDVHGQDLGVLECPAPGALCRTGLPVEGHRVDEEAVRGVLEDPKRQSVVHGEDIERIPAPIPMRLCCEGCGEIHLDEGEFATKPHHTHSCQHCGLTWRPAVCHTVGVKFLPGFRNDRVSDGALATESGGSSPPDPSDAPSEVPAAAANSPLPRFPFGCLPREEKLPTSLVDAIRRLPPDYAGSIADTAMRIFFQGHAGHASGLALPWMAAIVASCRCHGISCSDDGEVSP